MVDIFICSRRNRGGCGGGEAEKRVSGDFSTEAHHDSGIKKLVISSRGEEEKSQWNDNKE